MRKGKRKETKTSQIIVSTPLWLQRQMLKNLQSAARDKVNPARAHRAHEILASINGKSKPLVEPVRRDLADAVSPVTQTARGPAPQKEGWASAAFSKVRSGLIKAKAFFYLGSTQRSSPSVSSNAQCATNVGSSISSNNRYSERRIRSWTSTKLSPKGSGATS